MSIPPLLVLSVLQRRGWTDHRTLRAETGALRTGDVYAPLMKLLSEDVVERRSVAKYGYPHILEWRIKEGAP